MKELLPIEEIHHALNPDNGITDISAYLASHGWENLPLPLEQLIEITEVPALLFEVTVFSAFIEWEVISIVFGMSLLVAVLSDTGLFDMVSIRTIKMSEGVPKKFLVLVFFLTLVLSALLDNTTAIILLAGITITVTRGLDLNPKPYILAEAYGDTRGDREMLNAAEASFWQPFRL